METPQLTPQQEKIVDFLEKNVKYHGFGESPEIKNKITEGVLSPNEKFQISLSSEQGINNNKVDFTLNFKKDGKEENEKAFFNSFNASTTTEKGEERSHTFNANYTAKEAVNLLEGRAVKTESKSGDDIFVKLDFNKEKNEFNNYNLQVFHKEKYGVDTNKIVENSGIVFDKPEYKDNVIKSLEKGNITKVKFSHEGSQIDGNAVLNPQYKTLNLYDKDMNRLNTNKPLQGLEQDNSHEKNNVRQQNISRSI